MKADYVELVPRSSRSRSEGVSRYVKVSAYRTYRGYTDPVVHDKVKPINCKEKDQ